MPAAGAVSGVGAEENGAARREATAADHGHAGAGDLALPAVPTQLCDRLVQQSHAVRAAVRQLAAMGVERQDAVPRDVLATVEEVLGLPDLAEPQPFDPRQAVE